MTNNSASSCSYQLRHYAYTRLDRSVVAISETGRTMLRSVFGGETKEDMWLPGGATYRSRAYQCFDIDTSTCEFAFVPDPPPYYQSAAINSVAGGIERWLYVLPESHPATTHAVKVARTLIDLLISSDIVAPATIPRCVLDVHYMRVTAPGKPSPEGIHRDGLIAGSVHLIERYNITGGVSSVHAPDGTVLQSFDLTEPLDSFIFDDVRVLHYTADIQAAEPSLPGYRDVLVLGVRPPRDYPPAAAASQRH